MISVPPAPTIKKADAQPDYITVQVTPPDPPFGRILRYTIEMWMNETAGNRSSVDIIAPNVTHTYQDLVARTLYKFRVGIAQLAIFSA